MENFQEKHRQQGARMRSIMDYTMGIVFFCLGVFFVVYRFFGIRIMDKDPSILDFIIGGIFIAYGSWRIYRGYKKNYYR